MKISPLLGAINFLNPGPREARGTHRDGDNGRDQYSRQQGSQENDGENEQRQRSPERMLEAVQDFQTDPQTQASGIHATTEGSGPGLRVIVKDSGGSLIREFTGDEFLKLREAARDKRGRGKLLDQKL